MSMEGWWMVHTTVRPVLTVLRTVRITIAAARASRPTAHSGTLSTVLCETPRAIFTDADNQVRGMGQLRAQLH